MLVVRSITAIRLFSCSDTTAVVPSGVMSTYSGWGSVGRLPPVGVSAMVATVEFAGATGSIVTIWTLPGRACATELPSGFSSSSIAITARVPSGVRCKLSGPTPTGTVATIVRVAIAMNTSAPASARPIGSVVSLTVTSA